MHIGWKSLPFVADRQRQTDQWRDNYESARGRPSPQYQEQTMPSFVRHYATEARTQIEPIKVQVARLSQTAFAEATSHHICRLRQAHAGRSYFPANA